MAAVIAQAALPECTADGVARRERRFFSGMALAMLVVCFAGFAPSYYLKTQFSTPALKPLVHFHAIVFSLWMVLLCVQTSLVSNGGVKLHRQLGVAGAVLVVLMVVSGVAVTYVRGATRNPGIPHSAVLSFLAYAVVALVLFALLIGAALYFRGRPGTHKRLIVLATSAMMTAAVHRLLMWALESHVGPREFFAVTDLFIVALVAYDYFSLGRIHPATLWGGLVVVAAQPGSVALASSSVWMTFARWITGT